MDTAVLVVVMWVCSVWCPWLVTSQTCMNGYQLSEKYVCVDIDDCEAYGDPTYIASLCGAYTVCHNTLGSHYCTCRDGYVTPSGKTNFTTLTNCQELNECIDVPTICGANALCHNTLGSFYCQCKQGFYSNSDANGCVDINECESSPCGDHATCQNTNGGFTCRCDPGFVSITIGYHYSNTTVTHCKDINECESTPCGSNTTCHNTKGSFHCECDPGFVPSGGEASSHTTTTRCKDDNECERSPCGSNATCHNTEGSFQCTCDRGFVSSAGEVLYSNATRCEDWDECESRPCGPNATCQNTEGSYHCTCDPGFVSSCKGICSGPQNCTSMNDIESNIVEKENRIRSCKDHADCHQRISDLLRTIQDRVLQFARTLGHEERLNSSSDAFDLEMQTIRNNTIPDEETTTLSAGRNSLDISWKSVAGNSSFDSASVALISYKNLDSTINSSFQENQTEVEVVTDIVTVAVSNTENNELLEPVTLTFQNKHQQLDKGDLKCVSWDTKEGVWSAQGCTVLRANKTHIECSSRRVSSFAVLMALHGIKDEHIDNLNIITTVGIIVSLCCLAIALLTFCFCRSIKSVRTSIHKHLCLSLFLAELLFLVGIARTENQVVCAVIAGTLHYLFLVCFCWMLLEGVQLYLMVVQVFNAKSLRPKHMIPFGYGVPLLIVGTSAAIDSKGYVNGNYCWLDLKSGFLWAFVAPVCIIIVINATFFVITVYRLMEKFATLNPDMENLKKIRMFTFTAIAQLCLLGCTWIFGLFHFQDDTIAMAYIFTIINSAQGVFIFILHCLCNKQIRDEYTNCCAAVCHLSKPSKYSEFSTFTTQGLKSTQETGI